jgi:hypothetical protein
VALTAPRLSRLSASLSEDIGGALKRGVKVCQGNLVNEVSASSSGWVPVEVADFTIKGYDPWAHTGLHRVGYEIDWERHRCFGQIYWH